MKTKFLYINLIILFSLGLCNKLSGQPLSNNNIKTIINGKIWVPKTSISLGQQFFLDKMDLKGGFLFKGRQFENIKFAYDISNEEIITAIETQDNTKRDIVVNPHFLEGFSVTEKAYEFNFLRGDLIHPKLNPQAYYQIVKFHKLQYIVKRRKHRILKSDQSRKFKYVLANRLFIVKDQKLISISSKNDLLRIFPNKKKEMKRFIRGNKLKIGTKTPMDAVVLLSQFDI
jgi:hypothetical protein